MADEPPELTADERQQLVLLCRAISDAAKYGQRLPLPFEWPRSNDLSCPDCPESDVEDLALRLARLVLEYRERLQFIMLVAMTTTQTAVQRMEGAHSFTMTAVREMLRAAADGKFPEWWPEQRADAPVTR